MADAAPPQDPYFVAPFLGLRNQQRPELMPKGALTDAENVIHMADGSLQTRFGFDARWLALDNVQDFWGMAHERYAFVRAGDTIHIVHADGNHGVVVDGLTDETLSWASFGEHALYAGEQDAGWIANGQHSPLRLPMPPAPTVTVVPGEGVLKAGQYQITQVYRHIASGLETPAPPSVNIEAQDAAALQIDLAPPDGYRALVFVTECNKTVERFLGSGTSGHLTYTGAERLKRLLDLWQTGTYTMPTGVCAMAYFGQRLHVATYSPDTETSYVYYSQRGYLQAFRFASDVYALPGRIVQMLAVDDGILIATDRSVRLWRETGTDTGDLDLQQRLDYGCPAGRPLVRDSYGQVTIFTHRGLATYPPLQNTARFQFIPPKATACHIGVATLLGQSFALAFADSEGAAYNQYGA